MLPLTTLRGSLQARAYSVASKTRRTKPAFSFQPSPTPTASTATPLDAVPTARSVPSSVPNPGSSTLARPSQPSLPREPPLVEAARKKSVKQRNVFESYLVLNWRTRLYFWLVIAGVAVAGLYGGDYLLPENDEEKVTKGEAKTA